MQILKLQILKAVDFCSQIDYAATGRTRLRKEDKSAIMNISVKMRNELQINCGSVAGSNNCILAGWVQNEEKGKKQTFFLRAAMMVLTTILIVLFFAIMSMVGKIQGTARDYKLCGAGARWHAANGKIGNFRDTAGQNVSDDFFLYRRTSKWQ